MSRAQLHDCSILTCPRNSPRPGGEPSQRPTSRFRGTGQTLGGDDTPSQVIPDPHAPTRAADMQPQRRVLHLWSDGFSIEDGPLHRFDDPANAADLAVIRSGRAPIHLMNVSLDQPVDVQLEKHDENYKPPPKSYKLNVGPKQLWIGDHPQKDLWGIHQNDGPKALKEQQAQS